MKHKTFWRGFFSGFFGMLYIVGVAAVFMALLVSILLLMLGLTAQLLPYLDLTYQCLIAVITSSAIFAKLIS